MRLLQNRKKSDQRGLTLIEVSVILSVLAITSAFLVPSVGQYIQEANLLQARHDVAVIASSLINFMNDTGQSPAALGGYLGDSGSNTALNVLAGPGRVPAIHQGSVTSKPRTQVTAAARPLSTSSSSSTAAWREGRMAPLEDFLLANACGLPLKRAGMGMGWNGPYFNSQLGSDPWGNQYLVNVEFLDTQAGAGDADGVARRAVVVVSAGPNQIIETPFSQAVSEAFTYGDDIVARIR